MRNAVVATIGLTLVYVGAVGELKLESFAVGLVLAVALIFIFRAHVLPRATEAKDAPGLFTRIVFFLPMCLALLLQIAQGALSVTKAALSRTPIETSGLVKIPVGERSRTGAAITGLLVSLSPGSVLVDIDKADGTMVFHYLDARDKEKIARTMAQFYQRYQRKVFP